MSNPIFVEEKPLSLADVKESLAKIEKRDEKLNLLSNKCKEYVEQFVPNMSHKKSQELHDKLVDLKLTRLKEEHIAKIVDFLPKDAQDLRVVLQAYPLSLPKKDQDDILKTVQEFKEIVNDKNNNSK
ncbi:hypothetical protein J4437_05675 [Candidatus Woesearchaeota archaeon]|nr:hypothetical protein [Candidatus Woesearchaeota archaeon]